ncbi:MAG: hypothetical protein NTV63_05275 [Candidatus Woesearchaeota archaeon]|nr:hypothetical protein [Candidatus Woesearchaeota archaeon]
MFSKKSFFKNSRAQLTMEFIIFIAFGFVIMLGFLGIISDRQSILQDRRQLLLIKDIAYRIQSEIDVASIVEDGYSRNFTLPQTIEGLPYTAIIVNDTLAVFSSKFDYTLFFSEVKGSLNPIYNNIRKEEGVICLNMPSCP